MWNDDRVQETVKEKKQCVINRKDETTNKRMKLKIKGRKCKWMDETTNKRMKVKMKG